MRVVIAEDSVLLREGLARLLGENGFAVVESRTDQQRRGLRRGRPAGRRGRLCARSDHRLDRALEAPPGRPADRADDARARGARARCPRPARSARLEEGLPEAGAVEAFDRGGRWRDVDMVARDRGAIRAAMHGEGRAEAPKRPPFVRASSRFVETKASAIATSSRPWRQVRHAEKPVLYLSAAPRQLGLILSSRTRQGTPSPR